MSRRIINTCCWSLMLAVLAVVLCIGGCSGKSQDVTSPSSGQNTISNAGDQGVFRNFLWSNPPLEVDEQIPGSANDDRHADITNVVYDHYYPVGYPGRIKDYWPGGSPPIIYQEEDENTYTVVTWQWTDGGLSQISFRVLWRDDSGNYYKGSEFTVENPENWIYAWPAITANLRVDGLIVVDIAFQARETENDDWAIYYTRWVQGVQQDYDDFDQLIAPYEVYSVTGVNCIHPDIVIDATPYNQTFPSYQRLHLVFEINDGYQNGSLIYYMMGIDGGFFISWGGQTLEGVPSANSPAEYNTRPRIDVGYDDTGIIETYFDTNPSNDGYYVGVVWNTVEFDDDIHWANIMFAGFDADEFAPDPPEVVALTDNSASPGYVYEVFPYIEIDPVELEDDEVDRFTHVVWTQTVDEDPPNGDYEDGLMWGTFTGWISVWGISAFPLYEGATEGRDAFPVLATQVNEVYNSESQVWVRVCYVAWLNDEGPDSEDVEVWVGRNEFDDDNYFEGGAEQIGGGDTSILSPWNYGPEIAIYDEDRGRCVWTDVDEYGVPYTVFGDRSDW